MTDTLTKKYMARTLEPIHIGSRVSCDYRDGHHHIAETARDFDGLPFIPASSLKGCVRAICSSEYSVEFCDGKGWNCPQPHLCPSCAVFGFANFHYGKSSSSLVRFSSPNLVAIPVSTPIGIIWLTSWLRLERATLIEHHQTHPGSWSYGEALNPSKLKFLHSVISGSSQGDVSVPIETRSWRGPSEIRAIYENLVVVDESSMLQIATMSTGTQVSVAMDSGTEKVKPGALFGVEAIHKESLLAFDIVYVNPATRGIEEFLCASRDSGRTSYLPATLENIIQIVESGLRGIETFGIGGKRSRGYGRIRIYPLLDYGASQHSVEVHRVCHKSIPDVMISYSHADHKAARRLAADLTQNGLFVWLDEREILIGDDIHEKVGAAIKESRYLLVLLSQNSVQSNWVRDELNAGLTRQKKDGAVIVLPVILDSLPTDNLPPLLQHRKFGVLHRRYAEGLQEILLSIHGHNSRQIEF